MLNIFYHKLNKCSQYVQKRLKTLHKHVDRRCDLLKLSIQFSHWGPENTGRYRSHELRYHDDGLFIEFKYWVEPHRREI